LTTGKFGKMEVVSEGSAPSPEPEETEPISSSEEEPDEESQDDIAIEEDVIYTEKNLNSSNNFMVKLSTMGT
ncbi:hypothetical protein KY328_00430, partial [Candidatus Woesearchaeota archaeon]|nr:hypothetical protein [Candidatus Woesearchaeota archaeon]